MNRNLIRLGIGLSLLGLAILIIFFFKHRNSNNSSSSSSSSSLKVFPEVALTSNESKGYKVEGSTAADVADSDLFKMFDKDPNTFWKSAQLFDPSTGTITNNADPVIIGITFPQKQNVNKIRITPSQNLNNAPVRFLIYAKSSDQQDGVKLFSNVEETDPEVSWTDSKPKEIKLNSSQSYDQYAIIIFKVGKDHLEIAEIEYILE